MSPNLSDLILNHSPPSWIVATPILLWSFKHPKLMPSISGNCYTIGLSSKSLHSWLPVWLHSQLKCPYCHKGFSLITLSTLTPASGISHPFYSNSLIWFLTSTWIYLLSLFIIFLLQLNINFSGIQALDFVFTSMYLSSKTMLEVTNSCSVDEWEKGQLLG